MVRQGQSLLAGMEPFVSAVRNALVTGLQGGPPEQQERVVAFAWDYLALHGQAGMGAGGDPGDMLVAVALRTPLDKRTFPDAGALCSPVSGLLLESFKKGNTWDNVVDAASRRDPEGVSEALSSGLMVKSMELVEAIQGALVPRLSRNLSWAEGLRLAGFVNGCMLNMTSFIDLLAQELVTRMGTMRGGGDNQGVVVSTETLPPGSPLKRAPYLTLTIKQMTTTNLTRRQYCQQLASAAGSPGTQAGLDVCRSTLSGTRERAQGVLGVLAAQLNACPADQGDLGVCAPYPHIPGTTVADLPNASGAILKCRTSAGRAKALAPVLPPGVPGPRPGMLPAIINAIARANMPDLADGIRGLRSLLEDPDAAEAGQYNQTNAEVATFLQGMEELAGLFVGKRAIGWPPGGGDEERYLLNRLGLLRQVAAGLMEGLRAAAKQYCVSTSIDQKVVYRKAFARVISILLTAFVDWDETHRARGLTPAEEAHREIFKFQRALLKTLVDDDFIKGTDSVGRILARSRYSVRGSKLDDIAVSYMQSALIPLRALPESKLGVKGAEVWRAKKLPGRHAALLIEATKATKDGAYDASGLTMLKGSFYRLQDTAAAQGVLLAGSTINNACTTGTCAVYLGSKQEPWNGVAGVVKPSSFYFCPASSVADPMSQCPSSNSKDVKERGFEHGKMSFVIKSEDGTLQYELAVDALPNQMDITNALLKIGGQRFSLADAATGSIPVRLDNPHESPLAATTSLLKLLETVDIEGDGDPQRHAAILRASFQKGCGDFLQELNAVYYDGGYTTRKTTGSAISEPNAGRLLLSNDRPSGLRAVVLMLFGTGALNPNAVGGFITPTNNITAARTGGGDRAGGITLPDYIMAYFILLLFGHDPMHDWHPANSPNRMNDATCRLCGGRDSLPGGSAASEIKHLCPADTSAAPDKCSANCDDPAAACPMPGGGRGRRVRRKTRHRAARHRRTRNRAAPPRRTTRRRRARPTRKRRR